MSISLKRWRERANLSQDGMAVFISKALPRGQGITRSAVSRYENGNRMPPRAIVAAIVEVTKGAVDANSFYRD